MTSLLVDTAIPAGNGIIERIDGDTVWLRQDRRDTTEWWFWWHVRLRGAAGRTVRMIFTDGNVLTARGPAVSVDGGITWTWGEHLEWLQPHGFVLPIPAGADDVRVAMAIPYTSIDLDRFLLGHPSITREVLCASRKSRAVPLLTAGRRDGLAAHRMLLTARHHACESTASWVVEGFLDAAEADDELGRKLRNIVEIRCVPLVDMDGVEAGDQGKSRLPHDHNRDYGGTAIYPEIRAIRERASGWANGQLHLVFDLHCPWIRGQWNEHIYAVEQEDRHTATRLARFAAVLETSITGPFPYVAAGTIGHGTTWNTFSGPPRSCSHWFSHQPGVVLATTFEIPYAEVHTPTSAPGTGTAVTVSGARAFGRDLAAATARWLANTPEHGSSTGIC